MTHKVTDKVLDYQKFTNLRHQPMPEMTYAPWPYRSSNRSKWKTRTVSKCHLPCDFGDRRINTAKTDFWRKKTRLIELCKRFQRLFDHTCCISRASRHWLIALGKKYVLHDEKEHFWPPMANKVYTTLRDCGECLQNKPSEKRLRHLDLFSASRALEFVSVGIYGPRLKTSNGN